MMDRITYDAATGRISDPRDMRKYWVEVGTTRPAMLEVIGTG